MSLCIQFGHLFLESFMSSVNITIHVAVFQVQTNHDGRDSVIVAQIPAALASVVVCLTLLQERHPWKLLELE